MQQSNTVLSFWARVSYGEDEMFVTRIGKHEGETLPLPIDWEKWAELTTFKNGPAQRRLCLGPYTTISWVISYRAPSGPLDGKADFM